MMKKMKPIMFLLMFLFCIVVSRKSVNADETVTKGKYTYFSSTDTIYKMNSSTGKVTKIRTFSNYQGIKVIDIKGKWIYFEVNKYGGSDASWRYICRVKTNGNDIQTLDKGASGMVNGDYIYYVKLSFVADEDDEQFGYEKYLGIYRMKLNGKNRKRIFASENVLSYNWVKVYNKKIYVGILSDEDYKCEIYSMTTKGKNQKLLFSKDVSYNGTLPYFYKNKIYIGLIDNASEQIYSIDLKTKTSKKILTGSYLAGYSGVIYYSKKGNLNQYQIKKGTSKKVCRREWFHNVVGGKNWIIITCYQEPDYEAGVYNTAVERVDKKGKKKKVIETYHMQ